MSSYSVAVPPNCFVAERSSCFSVFLSACCRLVSVRNRLFNISIFRTESSLFLHQHSSLFSYSSTHHTGISTWRVAYWARPWWTDKSPQCTWSSHCINIWWAGRSPSRYVTWLFCLFVWVLRCGDVLLLQLYLFATNCSVPFQRTLPLTCQFCLFFYHNKQQDLEHVDDQIYRNLSELVNLDDVGMLYLEFVVTEDKLGVTETVDLIPGGKCLSFCNS